METNIVTGECKALDGKWMYINHPGIYVSSNKLPTVPYRTNHPNNISYHTRLSGLPPSNCRRRTPYRDWRCTGRDGRSIARDHLGGGGSRSLLVGFIVLGIDLEEVVENDHHHGAGAKEHGEAIEVGVGDHGGWWLYEMDGSREDDTRRSSVCGLG